MNQLLRELKLAVREMNQVAVEISVGVKTSGKNVRVECFEVGVDGSKPDSPVAVAEPESSLRIGTPFLWSPEAQPRYAIIISVEQGRVKEQGEIQFGFDVAGKIVVTEELKRIFPEPPKMNAQLPSLFVVGDSTAFSNGKNQRGWGDELRKFFDHQKINVRNRARPGRSTRSFRNEGLWSRVLAEMKAGDVVMIQFGHNDADKLAEGRCRGVLPGVVEEMQMVTMPDGSLEIVNTFGWCLRQFVAETKTKGTRPILLSLTAKNLWGPNGKFVRGQSDFGKWSEAVATACGVPFLDLTAMIADRFEELGREKVQPLFCDPKDNVHTSSVGAELNAQCVAAGLAEPKLPELKDYFKPGWK